MRSRSTLALLVAGLVAPAPLAAPREPAPERRSVPAALRPATVDTFTIDKTYSLLVYKVRHFGVSWFWGRINLPTGSFRLDDDDLAGSFIHVSAELKNMDTANPDRDRFLLGPDFFNVREHPTAEFRSTSIRRTGPGAYEAAGDFTMHGVTKPVTARVTEFTAAQTDRFGFRGGFEAEISVKRSDFGMDLFVKEGTLGDEVRIIASIQGLRPPQDG
jgi:polyisoprenoid-binding protein YceI